MIETLEDVDRAVAALVVLDPRLVPVVAAAGTVPLRRSEPDLRGLVATILAQQVSRASADAIFARLDAALDLNDSGAIQAAPDETLRAAGLSRPKQRTLRALAIAVARGELDLERVAAAPAPLATAELVALHGIGIWTAECHLLFGLGHEDVFPAGDLALQVAVARGLGLPERPAERALREIAGRWSPHRAVAARLFWAYYHAVTRRDAAPAEPARASGGERRSRRTGPARKGFTKATR